ncbi:hypothetical protein FOZ62_015034, partial [Perkinsus olseni]
TTEAFTGTVTEHGAKQAAESAEGSSTSKRVSKFKMDRAAKKGFGGMFAARHGIPMGRQNTDAKMTIQQPTGRQGVTDEQVTMIKQQVSTWMADYDASHDMAHIERVVATTKAIYGRDEIALGADRNLLLAVAYLHDSFDRKYCPDTTMKAQEILERLTEEPIGLSKSTAQFIIDKIHNVIPNNDNGEQQICQMSYSAELKSGRSAEVAADPYIAI